MMREPVIIPVDQKTYELFVGDDRCYHASLVEPKEPKEPVLIGPIVLFYRPKAKYF